MATVLKTLNPEQRDWVDHVVTVALTKPWVGRDAAARVLIGLVRDDLDEELERNIEGALAAAGPPSAGATAAVQREVRQLLRGLPPGV